MLENYNFKNVHISDINPELILCYSQIKSSVEQVIEELDFLIKQYPSREEIKRNPNEKEKRKEIYYSIRSEWNQNIEFKNFSGKDKSKRVAQTIFLNKTCFNGLFRVNSKGEFNVPIGNYVKPSFPSYDELRAVNKAIKNVEIHHATYETCIERISGKSLVYFDPPYRPLSKTSNFISYSKGDFNDKDQEDLAKTFKKLIV